jgi:hypothetical protein
VPTFVQGAPNLHVVEIAQTLFTEQSFPVQPSGHAHEKSDRVPTFVQTPPFLHVPATEQIELIEQSLPVFPAGQAQL